METAVLKQRILENIKAFKVSDFCPDGGWPKFDNLELIVYSQKEEAGFFIFNVELIYDCEKAGCCFIPGADNHTRLQKKIKLSETSFEVLSE
ncbi:hypothetical protein [Flavicella sediminum]|uniref:hypothetical protein n=1 Tax=Flavicella sediminum TaxID=2585141 RepID=UPI001122B7E3|nr:hypothetical protein [Flavicella sediminum]